MENSKRERATPLVLFLVLSIFFACVLRALARVLRNPRAADEMSSVLHEAWRKWSARFRKSTADRNLLLRVERFSMQALTFIHRFMTLFCMHARRYFHDQCLFRPT